MFDSSIIGCYEPDDVKLKFKELEMRIVIMNPKADIHPNDIRKVRQPVLNHVLSSSLKKRGYA